MKDYKEVIKALDDHNNGVRWFLAGVVISTLASAALFIYIPEIIAWII